MINDDYRANTFGLVRKIAQVSDAGSRRLGEGGGPRKCEKRRIEANGRNGEEILASV